MFELQYNDYMNEGLVNKKVLEDLRETLGDEAMGDFIRRFLADCEERTNRITEGYGKAYFSEVVLEAHTLGSSAATYGGQKLEEVCREIEFAKPAKSSVFQERVDRLNRLSDETIQEIKGYIREVDL